MRSVTILWLTLACIPAVAQEREELHVLILNSYNANTAPYAVANDVFIRELQQRHPTPIAFRQFDLDVRNDEPLNQDELRVQSLQALIAESRADLVLAISPPAIRFWLAHRDAIAPDALFVAMAADFFLDTFTFRPGDAAVGSRSSYADAMDNILQVLPGTSHVLMVFGSSAFERALANKAREELAGYTDRVDFEYTYEMPLEELQTRLTQLPANSAVLYVVLENDVNKVSFPQHTGLKLVRAASNMPVFGVYDDLLGHGIIGGRLIQVNGIRSEIAATAESLLLEKPTTVLRTVVNMSPPTFDWRELEAWDIDADLLPADSIIRFRPPSLWEKYSWWIVAGVLLIIAQIPLAVSALRKNRQWRKAEAMRTELASRLITAHEDERRLLARELHDDLSQRLARLAIDTSYVTTHPGTATAKQVLEGLHPELVRISKDVHDLSYRLHPSLIDDLGLGTALETECERARRLTDAKISAGIATISTDIPPDKLLCIYRIAQESLQNAIRHARARNIEVMLDDDGQALELTVRDDGVGFDPSVERGKPSLGLLSMSERALLAGGSLDIESQPQRGSVVKVVVPYRAKAA